MLVVMTSGAGVNPLAAAGYGRVRCDFSKSSKACFFDLFCSLALALL